MLGAGDQANRTVRILVSFFCTAIFALRQQASLSCFSVALLCMPDQTWMDSCHAELSYALIFFEQASCNCTWFISDSFCLIRGECFWEKRWNNRPAPLLEIGRSLIHFEFWCLPILNDLIVRFQGNPIFWWVQWPRMHASGQACGQFCRQCEQNHHTVSTEMIST